MQKIAIVCVSNDLATDQRVHKTCLTLEKCGYQVTEIGRLLPGSQPLSRTYRTLRKKLYFINGPLFYAELNVRLFIYLMFAKVDLIFSNDLDTLLAAFLASKLRKKRLIYDTHEYYTETPELVSRPRTQTIWKAIENFIFPKLTDIITVNGSIAKLYGEKFDKHVHISRNIPLTYKPEKIKSRKELGLPEDKRIIIIQGTGINVDRGAEEACLAMHYIENCILLIIGSGDALPGLHKIVEEQNLRQKVFFRNKLPFADLRQYTMNCDLGMAIDKDTNLNYHFALPNKLFDFIHSGIPVLSSELPELKKIIDQYDIGYYINNHHPKHIAEIITNIFSDNERYNVVKQHTTIAKKELCWENEENVLLGIING